MQGYGARPLRIFLVDDHDLVRRGLRDLVAPSRDIDVVGEAASAAEAAKAIIAAEPDVMLVDLQLQDGTGISVCRTVRSARPRVHGLLLTAASDDDALAAAVLAGAAGYLIKLASSLAVVSTLRRLGSGRSLMGAADHDRAVTRLRALASADGSLSATDRDVLDDVLDGRTDAEIGARLGLSRDALDRHLATVVERTVGIRAAGPA